MNTTRHIFLLDGLGALASLVGTAYLLPMVGPWIGLPTDALLRLAAPAAVFMAYSLSCWMLSARLHPWLSVVMVANLSYCALLLFYLAHHVETLTPWGWAYFLGEIAVVGAVLWAERAALMSAREEETPPQLALST